jgi:hypothetical protein
MQGEANNSGWISVCGAAAPDLERAAAGSLGARLASGTLQQAQIDYLRILPLRAVERTLKIDEDTVGRLRTLCQRWEVDLVPNHVTSHRKIIGPVIVFAKKAAIRLFLSLFGDTFKRQRDFNASVIEFLIESSNQAASRDHER